MPSLHTRQAHWPHEMLATTTHDTKRSEDVRVRIDVLSEFPTLWRRTINRWRRLHRSRKRIVDGQMAPGPNQEYLLYQTLVGSWPLTPMDEPALADYRTASKLICSRPCAKPSCARAGPMSAPSMRRR